MKACGWNRPPSYDLRATTRAVIAPLVELHHSYHSLSSSLTYAFAVFEDGVPVAAYAWQPPAFGAARAVCPAAPYGVLSLSRMAAVCRGERRLRHISKPLRRQMSILIDRTRWPVLVTYSDEGEGHNGFVYQCSGWTATARSERPVTIDRDGARRSAYSNGRHGSRDGVSRIGSTLCQRWEHRACQVGLEAEWMASHGWRRVPVAGKTWASGNQAYTFVNAGNQLVLGDLGPRE